MSIKHDVDRGLEIRAQLEKLETELKDIETRLQMAGLQNPGEHEDLKDAERDGRQWLARGSDRTVPVIFTADYIVGEFKRDGDIHKKILDVAVATPELQQFFKPVNKFENRFDSGKKFRALASEVLGGNAPRFITACLARDKDGQPRSRIVVAWKESEAAGH